MKIIIQGKREEGCSTLAHYIYWFCKMLGYNVRAIMFSDEREKVVSDEFNREALMGEREVIISTENYEEDYKVQS